MLAGKLWQLEWFSSRWLSTWEGLSKIWFASSAEATARGITTAFIVVVGHKLFTFPSSFAVWSE